MGAGEDSSEEDYRQDSTDTANDEEMLETMDDMSFNSLLQSLVSSPRVSSVDYLQNKLTSLKKQYEDLMNNPNPDG